MASRTAVSIDEYLRTSYPDLDREYWDGEVVERSVPAYRHGRTQKQLSALLDRLEQSHPLFACVETRLRVSPTRCLIPDVSVFSPAEPSEPVPSTPPLVVIEILSIDDRWSQVREKLEEYRRWGVTHVWLVDPRTRRLYVCTAALSEVGSFHLPEFEIEIMPAGIFD